MSAQKRTIESGATKSGTGALAASACVLGAMVLLAGSGVFDRPVQAEMSTHAGSYRMMTTDGSSAEFLAVVDNLSEQLLIYTVTPQQDFELQIRRELPGLFRSARARAGMP